MRPYLALATATLLLATGIWLLRPTSAARADTDVATQLRHQLLRERRAHAEYRAKIRKVLRSLKQQAKAKEKEISATGIGYVSPRDGAWQCIHSHEGAWNDPNPPYWGGLQMDRRFMETYGSEFLLRYGTADKWPMSVQIMVADRAYEGYGGYGGRGFSPWPNTARMCGLL
jgi:hypothetical protein